MDRRDTLRRARRRLWLLTFTIIASLAVVVVYLAANADAGVRPAVLPSTGLLGAGLGVMIVAFALYVVDAERKVRALSDRLREREDEGNRLREAERTHRDFLSMAAHELRAPLTAIKGYTRTLMMKHDQLSDEKRHLYLSTVNEQSDRLARLVDDLMDVSRIDAGMLKLAQEDLDTTEVVDSLLAQFTTKWAGRRIEVHTDGGEPPRVIADRHRLDGILINLIDNAIKYSPAGTAVEVTVARKGAQVAFSVRDHGAGMTENERQGLFQKFHRLPGAAASDVPGTGLGLYIVKGLVDAHGGMITVDSAPGGGSTFTVALPAAPAASRAAAQVPE